jgi:hypothetical protein
MKTQKKTASQILSLVRKEVRITTPCEIVSPRFDKSSVSFKPKSFKLIIISNVFSRK